MAIARCDKCGLPAGLKLKYFHPHEPKQHRVLLCGAHQCSEPVHYVWLTAAEQAEYIDGKRFFTAGTRRRHVEVA
jgi:hypothetical protein